MVVALPNYRSSAGVQLTESRLVADLSEHADALLNQQDISDLLTDEQERKIAEYVKACAEMSYHQVSKRYGSWIPPFSQRHTFLIDPEGVLQERWLGVRPLGHSQEILKRLDELQA